MPGPTQQYKDIFIRENFGDTGIYPSQGSVSSSPDIVPYQTGQLTWAQLSSSYASGPDNGKDIVSPGINNIYVRAKNLWPGVEQGTVNLYYTKASMLLLPGQWKNNQISANGNVSPPFVGQANSPNIAANEICVGNPPFVLQGLAPAPNDHYCLIAVVQTVNNPFVIPTSFSSNATFAQWVQNNPAVAWRNIGLVANPQQTMVSNAGFGNDNATKTALHFAVLGRGFPENTQVVVQCSDVRAPAFSQTVLLPKPDGNGDQLAGFDQEVNANYFGQLTYAATAPRGQSFTPSVSLTVEAIQVELNPDDEVEQAVAHTMTLTGADPEDPAPRTLRAFRLGECTIRGIAA